MVQDEKIANFESQRDEVKMKYEVEIQALREQLMGAGEQMGKDRDYYINENDRLKSAL